MAITKTQVAGMMGMKGRKRMEEEKKQNKKTTSA